MYTVFHELTDSICLPLMEDTKTVGQYALHVVQYTVCEINNCVQ